MLPRAQIRLNHLRIITHSLGQPLGNLLPIVHDNDPIRQLHDQRKLVLDQQNGEAALLEGE